MNEPASGNSGDHPARWYVVATLSLLYMLSYVDRSILAVTATGVTASLGLSDTQMSLVIGAGFAFVYAGVGIPVAHWMDNGDRRLGVIVGVVVWSIATVASSGATGFWSLLTCRAGVAVGEAVLTPAAVSLIADLFSPRRRTAPMTAYSAVGALMGMGSLVGGAAVLRLGERLSGTIALEPWRIALLLLGLAGFLFALLIVLTIREPARVGSGPKEGTGSATFVDFIRYLGANRRFYLPFYIGSGVSTLFPMALMNWSPSLLVRHHGFGQAQAAYYVGTVGVAFSIGGTLAWPMLARALEPRFPGRGAVVVLVCAAAIGLLAVAAPASDNPRIVTAGVGLTMGCLAAWSILPALIVQRFGPSRMRARMIALHLFFISAFGYALGPLIAVRLAGFWGSEGSQGANGLGIGLASLGLIAVPCSLICYVLNVRAVGMLLEDDSTLSDTREAGLSLRAARAFTNR